VAEVQNLETIIEAGLAQVGKRIRVEAAYLFGSQLTGEAKPDSDIDVAIFSPDVDNLGLFERVKLRSRLVLDCDSRLEFHLFSSRALSNARPTNFAGYIVAHGKRLI